LHDVYLEEIHQLESDDRAEGVRILYAHRDLTVNQAYVSERLRASGWTQLRVEVLEHPAPPPLKKSTCFVQLFYRHG